MKKLAPKDVKIKVRLETSGERELGGAGLRGDGNPSDPCSSFSTQALAAVGLRVVAV